MTSPFPGRRRAATLAAALALLLSTASAQAALQARDADGDGQADGCHDTMLGITWLARADAAAGSAQDDGLSSSDGLLTWVAAQARVAGVLLFAEGDQDTAFKACGEHAAWAVHDGDVLAVPEPATGVMLLAGLLSLVWRSRRCRC